VSIQSLFARPAALPVVPKVVAQLVRSFERDDVAIDEIASRLAADPVLSAKMLRLANSAYFHVSRRVETVDDALRLLGFVMVRNLVLGLGVANAFKPAPGVDLPQFWRHSVHTACAARWLAQAAGHDGELAFTVGLIHGLGHLVMHAVMGRDLASLDRLSPLLGAERAMAERAALGYHHGDVGAELALRWRFPQTIAEPLRVVPAPAGADAAPVAQLVHVAAWRARIEALRLPAGAIAAECPHAVARRLGLQLAWLSEPATLAVESIVGPREVRHMPPLAQLCGGLEAML